MIRFDTLAPKLFIHLSRKNLGFWKFNAHLAAYRINPLD
jgi:hypothetical protein